MMSSRYTFSFPSQMSSEERLLDQIVACLEKHGIRPAIRQPILLMISEAFTNAMVHGNRLDPTKNVVVELEVNDSEIAADILDEGHDGMQRIEKHSPGGLLAEGGRGLELIRHYASRLDIAETDWGGLRVSLAYSLLGKEKTC